MTRCIFIGDVHGCLEELEDLLAAIRLKEGDRLLFVGDLVDRGPDPVGCVRRVKGLIATYPGSNAVCGNHEEKWLRYRDHGRELPGWAKDADDADWEFMNAMPLLVRVPEAKAVVVHAGFFPAYFENEGAVGEVASTWRTDRDRRSKRLRRFLRVRNVDAAGNMLALDSIRPEHEHWSALYDGREGYCFYGHDIQLNPPEALRGPNAMGLDTGCCFGGRLTAAIVPAGTTPADAELISVPARDRYAEPRDRRRE